MKHLKQVREFRDDGTEIINIYLKDGDGELPFDDDWYLISTSEIRQNLRENDELIANLRYEKILEFHRKGKPQDEILREVEI